MKTRINWKQFAIIFIVVCCTYTIAGKFFATAWGRFFATAGVLMLLLLIDGLLLEYDNRRRGRKQSEEIVEHLKDADDKDQAARE